MREMLSITGALSGQGLGESVGLITDGPVQWRHARPRRRPRFPGSLGRRADPGGRTGRQYQHRRGHETLTLNVDEATLAKRKSAWTAPPPRVKAGVLAKYAKLARSASEGAGTG